MKDLRLNKERLAKLQESQLENIIGGTETDPEIKNSCKKRSCNPDQESTTDEIQDA